MYKNRVFLVIYKISSYISKPKNLWYIKKDENAEERIRNKFFIQISEMLTQLWAGYAKKSNFCFISIELYKSNNPLCLILEINRLKAY